ncbi:MAG: HlyD family efflux transporter periplasmic adaptor subunit [Candidatus Sericytochromatia bacterium]
MKIFCLPARPLQTLWVLLLCLSSVLSSCQPETQVNWELHTVTVGDLELSVQETGALGSAREVWVNAPFAGTLSQLIPEGTVLKAGQVLGQIETTAQQQERDTARLSLSEAQVDRKLADVTQATQRQDIATRQKVASMDVQIETLRLRQLKEERDPVALTRARENLRSLAQRMEILELEARERTRLFGLGYLSREERDQAQLQLEQARKEQQQFQAELKVLEAGPIKQDIAKQQLQVQRTRDEQRRIIQEQQVQKRVVDVQRRSAEGRIKRFQEREKYYAGLVQAGQLKSPAAGTLVYGKLQVGDQEVPVKSGDAVQEGVPLVQLVDLEQPLVRLMIHEIDAPRIKANQDVRLNFDAYPDTSFAGKVVKILPVARQASSEDRQEVRAFSAEVKLLGKDPRLRPGMTAQAEIVTQRFAKVLTVPTQAIVNEAGESYCWVLSGAEPVRKRVKVGASDARNSLIESGLSAGEQVILNPPAPEPTSSPEPDSEATSSEQADAASAPPAGEARP